MCGASEMNSEEEKLKINKTEFVIINLCARWRRSVMWIWRTLNMAKKKITYNYVSNVCSRLCKINYLEQKRIGRNVFYLATKEGLDQAVMFFDLFMKEQEKRSGSDIVKPIRNYIRH